ncbi:MAG TPA: class I SAM-dependent methyltransferase [Thermomicrobiales bacterium]|nr:class I SAM-dependent methyltransferase [Thermomicrobiales bacterium]
MNHRDRYTDLQAAELYDVLNPWSGSDAFFLDWVMGARSAIDIGCGTGRLLHRAREAGHTGELVGIDPDPGMIAVASASRVGGVAWRQVRAAEIADRARFDLAVMASHGFQYLATDEELDRSLAAIARALKPGGRFVFDTRNPLAREWETWTPEHPVDVVDPAGRELRMVYHVEEVTADRVTFTESTCDRDGWPLRVDRATFRFLPLEALNARLHAAGFVVEAQSGDYDGTPFTPDAAEIVTVAVLRRDW